MTSIWKQATAKYLNQIVYHAISRDSSDTVFELVPQDPKRQTPENESARFASFDLRNDLDWHVIIWAHTRLQQAMKYCVFHATSTTQTFTLRSDWRSIHDRHNDR